jgi:hypothetical protein
VNSRCLLAAAGEARVADGRNLTDEEVGMLADLAMLIGRLGKAL